MNDAPSSNEPCMVAIFTRAPAPGKTKTRLIPRLGADGAARLHAALIRHTLSTTVAANVGPIELWCEDPHDPFFDTLVQAHKISLHGQPGGDLGARMLACFEAHPQTPCLLVGTDAPCITPDDLRACASALAHHDAVFLPAEDGGYALVGTRRPLRQIFENIAWGVDSVMADTRALLRRHNLTWAEPHLVWDIDRPADFDRLAASGLMPDWSELRAGD